MCRSAIWIKWSRLPSTSCSAADAGLEMWVALKCVCLFVCLLLVGKDLRAF